MFDMCDDAHLEVKQNIEVDYQEGDLLDVISGPFAGYVCDANGKAHRAGTVSYVNSAMIMTDDEAKMEASKKFLSFLMEPGNYGRFINMEPGLFLPITEAGSEDSTFWDDPVAIKYKSQIETMLDNSTRGSLFGFTNGNTFTSISSISAQNLLAQTLQLTLIDGKSAKDAVSEGMGIMTEAIE